MFNKELPYDKTGARVLATAGLLFRSRFTLDVTRLNSAVCRFAYCLLVTAHCLMVLSGCDETFQPLKNSDTAAFSMYGYLDASADTQWVRVTPVRDRLAMPPAKPDMRVMLEEEGSGKTAVMNDSLFKLPNGINYLNVWTTMDIEPERTYHLVAERPDGAVSRVTVTTPEEFPTPVFQNNGSECTGNLRITGVDRLADVQSKWLIRYYFSGRVQDRYFFFPYRDEVYSDTAGTYSVYIDTYRELNSIEDRVLTTPDSVRYFYRRIFVASGGPGWIENIGSLGELEYALPEGLSNVENGVGYVVGIVSKTIPVEGCI